MRDMTLYKLTDTFMKSKGFYVLTMLFLWPDSTLLGFVGKGVDVKIVLRFCFNIEGLFPKDSGLGFIR